MWFNFKSKREAELEAKLVEAGNKIFELEGLLTQAEQFERICSSKLEEWVGKHDQLLTDFKEYKTNVKTI